MKQVWLIALAGFAVSGCGFHPLYDTRLQPQLSSIYVEPLEGRDGYALRNTLIDLLGSDGREAGKAYHLTLTLNQVSNGVTLQNDATITRYNDTITATYVLTDARGTEITRGSQTSLSSFNVSSSPYSTLAAQQDSDRRAGDDIADRIRMDLGVFFSRRK
jgi:LPS-assembly lipoprotein